MNFHISLSMYSGTSCHVAVSQYTLLLLLALLIGRSDVQKNIMIPEYRILSVTLLRNNG